MRAGGGGKEKPDSRRGPATTEAEAVTPVPFRGMLGNKHIEDNGSIAKFLAQGATDHYRERKEHELAIATKSPALARMLAIEKREKARGPELA